MIKKLREDRGWSQEQLAEISGISVRTIQRIESGQRASLETLKCLAAVFETNIPTLKSETKMTDQQTYVLTPEDRAALKYAHYLKSYDEFWHDHYGWDDWLQSYDKLTPDERAAYIKTRRRKDLLYSSAFYLAFGVFLFGLNYVLWPSYSWSSFACISLFIAWSIQMYFTFGGTGRLGVNHEQAAVERHLKRLEDNIGDK